MSVTDIIALVACVLICARLILFRRTGMRYRWYISALAWLRIVCAGSMALDIVLHRGASITWAQAGIVSIVCLLTFLARGNLAHILRLNHDH